MYRITFQYGTSTFNRVLLAVCVALASVHAQPSLSPPLSGFGQASNFHLPFEWVSASSTPSSPDRVAARRADVDQLPEGPQSFEVLKNGTILITDPLWPRIAVLRDGKIVGAVKLNAPVERIAADSSGKLMMQSPFSDEFQLSAEPWRFDSFGSLPRRDASGRAVKAENGGGRIVDVRGAKEDIKVKAPVLPLLALRRIPSDDEFVYVLLQSKRASNPIQIAQIVRKYSKDDQEVCELSMPSSVAYIRPLDEFRVTDGKLYRMVPSNEDLAFSVWDVRGCR